MTVYRVINIANDLAVCLIPNLLRLEPAHLA
jgi:hypothetical protein